MAFIAGKRNDDQKGSSNTRSSSVAIWRSTANGSRAARGGARVPCFFSVIEPLPREVVNARRVHLLTVGETQLPYLATYARKARNALRGNGEVGRNSVALRDIH